LDIVFYVFTFFSDEPSKTYKVEFLEPKNVITMMSKKWITVLLLLLLRETNIIMIVHFHSLQIFQVA